MALSEAARSYEVGDADYYVRSDGTATKANSTQGGQADQAMSVTTFNAVQDFVAGDIILFENDATYTTAVKPHNQLATIGTFDNPLIIAGPSPGNPFVLSTTSGNAVDFSGTTFNYMEFCNFDVSTNTASSDHIRIHGGAGASDDGFTLKFKDYILRTNNGASNNDGVAMASGASGGKAQCVRGEARAFTGGSRSVIMESGDKTLKMTDCTTTSACEDWLLAQGGELILEGGHHRAFDDVITGSGTDVTIRSTDTDFTVVGTSGARLFVLTTGSKVYFKGGTITTEAGANGTGLAQASSVEITMDNVTLNHNAASRLVTLQNEARFTFTNSCKVVVTNCGSDLVNMENSGGHIRSYGTIWDLSGLLQTGKEMLNMNTDTTAGTLEVIGNVLLPCSVDNTELVRIAPDATGTAKLNNNTAVSMSGASSSVFNQVALSLVTVEIYNNIFDDCVNALSGSLTGVTKDFNAYSGTTPDETDTNGTTEDVVFIDKSGEDYQLAASSPEIYIDGGLVWWSTQTPQDASDNLYNPAYPSLGAYQDGTTTATSSSGITTGITGVG